MGGGRSVVPGIIDSGPMQATESEYFRNTRGTANPLSPYITGKSGICNVRQARYWMEGKKETPFAKVINRHCDFWDKADGVFDGYYSVSSEYGDLMVCNDDWCNDELQSTAGSRPITYSVLAMFLVMIKSFF